MRSEVYLLAAMLVSALLVAFLKIDALPPARALIAVFLIATMYGLGLKRGLTSPKDTLDGQ